jgi:hypothetical protein
VCLRKSPDEPAVRLGDGDGLALSPDGKLVLARLRGDAQRNPSLVLLPTGAGDQRSIPSGKLNQFAAAAWLPDGKNMIVRGAEAGKGRRLYLVDPVRGPGRAISAEGARDGMAISPDGKFVAARIGQEIRICSVEGTGERPLPGQQLGDVPVSWTGDGSAIYVFRSGPPPVEVFRIAVATGARELWKRLSPPDAAGVETISRVLITPDGKGYVYGYGRRYSDLFVVEGLR